MVYGYPMWKQENILQELTGANFLYFLGLESYNAVWELTPGVAIFKTVEKRNL